MKKKKLLSKILLGIVVTTLSVGCSNGNQVSNTSSDNTSTPSSSTSSKAIKEVSVWHYFEHEAEALEKFIDEYNEMQDDINIVATYVSRDELMNQYTIGAVSGELPDIGMVDSPDMASYISLGIFEDITDELQAWEDLDKFYEGPLSSCMDSEGRIYGLPNNSNCLALVCNMDILNAAGYTEPPTTWEEFYEIAKATTDPEDSVYGFAMSAIANEEGTFQYIPWLYGAGGSVSTLSSSQSIESIEFLANLVQEGYMSKEVINWGQGDAYNAFIAGKAAMLESGTWQVATIDEDLQGNFNYQYALLPKGEQYATVIGGENFGVCTGTEAKEECIEFLKYMQSAQNNAEWCEIAGKLPVRSDAVELKDFWTEDERYAVFNEAMNYSVARGPHESWPTISKAMYTAMQATMLGEKSATDALAEAAIIVDPILEEKPIAGQ